MRLVFLYFVGLVFGLGISISGMVNPAKVINFFDITGSWDPSLAFVMGGALAVTLLGYRLVLRRTRPVMTKAFQIPSNIKIDIRLIAGAVIFGVGWGIAGFCPGGALPALGTGQIGVIVFTAAMIGGIIMTRLLLQRLRK